MTAILNHLITIRFKQLSDGSLIATSDDLPGLVLTRSTREEILEEIPEAVEILYKQGFGEDVRVVLLDSPNDPPMLKRDRIPVAAIAATALRKLAS